MVPCVSRKALTPIYNRPRTWTQGMLRGNGCKCALEYIFRLLWPQSWNILSLSLPPLSSSHFYTRTLFLPHHQSHIQIDSKRKSALLTFSLHCQNCIWSIKNCSPKWWVNFSCRAVMLLSEYQQEHLKKRVLRTFPISYEDLLDVLWKAFCR